MCEYVIIIIVLRNQKLAVAFSEAEAEPNKAKINACTKWCVVEGLFKQENKALWRRIHLLGGKPMISNSFGKRVPFVLEPCGLTTPDNCDDNYICGTCVRDNETALRWQGSSRVVHSSVTPQDVVNLGKMSMCMFTVVFSVDMYFLWYLSWIQFDQTSSNFVFGDHFFHSHYLHVCLVK